MWRLTLLAGNSRRRILMSHFYEFDFSLTGDNRKRPDAEVKAEKAKREHTLAGMGIKPLSAYTLPVETTGDSRSRFAPRFTPRKMAKLQGEKFYFPTRPCVRGHRSKRFTASANCAACQDIYRYANADRVRKHSRLSHRRARDRRKA